MTLRMLHTVTGILILSSFFGKILMHYYLEYLHDRTSGIDSILITPLQYLLPYRQHVNQEHLTLKHWCNFFFTIGIISLALNIIVGILIYLNR